MGGSGGGGNGALLLAFWKMALLDGGMLMSADGGCVGAGSVGSGWSRGVTRRNEVRKRQVSGDEKSRKYEMQTFSSSTCRANLLEWRQQGNGSSSRWRRRWRQRSWRCGRSDKGIASGIVHCCVVFIQGRWRRRKIAGGCCCVRRSVVIVFTDDVLKGDFEWGREREKVLVFFWLTTTTS